MKRVEEEQEEGRGWVLSLLFMYFSGFLFLLFLSLSFTDYYHQKHKKEENRFFPSLDTRFRTDKLMQ